MPDRTRDISKRRASTAARVARWRARQRIKREAAKQAAKIAHRAELDAARVARGLAPAKTSTERAAETRARQAEAKEIVRTEGWYSPSFQDWWEAKVYLSGLKSDVPEPVIENILETTRREAPKWELNWNRFVVCNGIAEARLRRAIVWQILDVLYQQDITHLRATMQQAETRTDIAFEEDSHPTVQFQERQRVYDMSQIMLGDGGNCRAVEIG